MFGEKLFSVPDRDMESIKFLANTKIEDLQKIEKALCEEEPTLDLEALSTSVSGKTKIDKEIIGRIIALMWRFAIIKQRMGITTKDFLNTLISSLKEMNIDQWSNEDTKKLEKVKDYVAKVLSPDSSLIYGAKAAELMLEQQLLFCNARILTDIRPVFDEDAERVENFVPFHILSIKYHEEQEHREIQFAMDLNDIIKLRKQLSRAEQKEKQIRKFLTEKGIKIIKTSSESDV